jgi:transcriptional regulator with XRE-family HTH domain
MSNDGADWDKLAQYVIAQRTALDMTQVELARASGLSLDRVSAVEGRRARSLRPRTIRSLEAGLEWENGSVQAILAGGVPTVRVPVGTVEQLDPELPVQRIVEGRATVGSGRAHDATVTTIEPRVAARLEEISQKVGLEEHPPFPNPTSKTQQAANAMWRALRLLAEDEPSDASVRMIRRGTVDLEELQEREKLRGSG